jgi:hypothetical protein
MLITKFESEDIAVTVFITSVKPIHFLFIKLAASLICFYRSLDVSEFCTVEQPDSYFSLT